MKFRGICLLTDNVPRLVNFYSKVFRFVAVGRGGKVYPPCGRCREFIYQINNENLEADVLVGDDKIVKLKELLPYHTVCSKLLKVELWRVNAYTR